MYNEIYVLGPSHIHSEYTEIIKDEVESHVLFNKCILDGVRGLPNWSSYINNTCTTHKDKPLIWIVSDYKFNNHDYPILKELPQSNLFLDVMGYPGNVNCDFMSNEHITFLAKHTQKVIDYIVSTYPHIKLIFWCLYKRSKGRNSSYPIEYQYDAMKNRYAENIIDIDLYTSPNTFQTVLTRDEGGHPTREGYMLLSRMITENISLN